MDYRLAVRSLPKGGDAYGLFDHFRILWVLFDHNRSYHHLRDAQKISWAVIADGSFLNSGPTALQQAVILLLIVVYRILQPMTSGFLYVSKSIPLKNALILAIPKTLDEVLLKAIPIGIRSFKYADRERMKHRSLSCFLSIFPRASPSISFGNLIVFQSRKAQEGLVANPRPKPRVY